MTISKYGFSKTVFKPVLLLLLTLQSLLLSQLNQAQVVTVAAGQTIRAATQHDSYRAEVNFGWIAELGSFKGWNISLNHALSVMTFRDENTVDAISWAPNVIFSPSENDGSYPYLQVGFGAAYLSEKEFESNDSLYDDGTSDMGSHGQFESSLALGYRHGKFGVRAKVYHYSNAGLASPNQGMDVAEFGISYEF